MSHDPVFADPEAIRGLSVPYSTASDEFVGVAAWFHQLRNRYVAAFGDDDIGVAFVNDFNQQHAVVQDGVEGMSATLEYHAVGLRGNANRYEETEEGATKYSHALLTNLTGGREALSARLTAEMGVAIPAQPATDIPAGILKDPVRSLGERLPAGRVLGPDGEEIPYDPGAPRLEPRSSAHVTEPDG